MQAVSRATDLKTDTITSSEVPDPKELPDIPGYYILVRPIKPQEKAGSILLPDSFRHDVEHLTNIGRVLKLGDMAFHDPSCKPEDAYYPYGIKFKKPWCKVGDHITWKKFGGKKFLYNGVHLTLIADDEILFRVKNPETFNLMFNLTKLST